MRLYLSSLSSHLILCKFYVHSSDTNPDIHDDWESNSEQREADGLPHQPYIRFDPHKLSVHEYCFKFNIPETWLKKTFVIPHSRKPMVIGEETYCFQYDRETKCQSAEWRLIYRAWSRYLKPGSWHLLDDNARADRLILLTVETSRKLKARRFSYERLYWDIAPNVWYSFPF